MHGRLANFGTFLALASYSRHKSAQRKRDAGRARGTAKHKHLTHHCVRFGATVQTLFSMAFTLYLWYTNPTKDHRAAILTTR